MVICDFGSAMLTIARQTTKEEITRIVKIRLVTTDKQSKWTDALNETNQTTFEQKQVDDKELKHLNVKCPTFLKDNFICNCFA